MKGGLPTPVFRIEKTRDYTVMANHHLKNRKLSLKAKGLLSVMLSLPETWDYTLRGLACISLEGVDAIYGAHIWGNFDAPYIDITAADAEAECDRYAALLAGNPTDIVVMGIGENGHIAFNDPPVADFCDARAVKPVELDEICRNQQVNDGCFAKLEDVPKTAITLTVPTLFAGDHLFCIVPAKTKANAVRATLNDEICEKCPATVLRRHGSAVLYLDGDSSALL